MNKPNTSTIPKQIRKWACYKLECFSNYIEAYIKTLQGTKRCYLELYAGCGSCICKDTDCCIDSSELRALKTKTKFSKYIFVVRNPRDAENLKQLTASLNTDNTIEIITGNYISENVIHRLFDSIPRSASSLAFIDPPGYRRMRWSTIKKLATHGNDWKGHKIELLIVFPLEMALLRNLTRQACQASITRLYGNEQWQDIRQDKLSGKIGLDEVRQRLVELFKAGLKALGYKHVSDFRPTRFSNPPLYHLILASDRDSGTKILKDTWGKPRYLPCELLYSVKEPTKQDIKT
jgi:three-Cys-motif partner protein